MARTRGGMAWWRGTEGGFSALATGQVGRLIAGSVYNIGNGIRHGMRGLYRTRAWHLVVSSRWNNMCLLGLCRLVFSLCAAAMAVPAQAKPATVADRPADKGALKRFLLGYLGRGATATYLSAEVRLDGTPEQDVLVYIEGGFWCGSGGCPLLILAEKHGSYRVVTKVSIVHPPIRVLQRRSHGWKALAVRVQGGGVIPGYEAELPFNGTTYPSNPSMLPARRLQDPEEGEVAVSGNETPTQLP